jgi:isocitrate/isopropylmalate dehydrogenase
VLEAVHGSAPDIAGKGIANPRRDCSNGTAALGLGNRERLAAKPVMEGKGSCSSTSPIHLISRST